MKTLGVIPARGNSKRLKRKNCRLLHNVPLIGYTIRAAQSAVGLTDYVVSTEDEEIKNIALSYGATVVDRPVALAGDDITSGDVLRHALDTMEGGGERYDIIVCLHPTSPIRDPKHIDQAIKLLRDNYGIGYVASVYKLPTKTHPNVFCDWGRESSGSVHYILNGSIYAMDRKSLIETGRHVNCPKLFEMDRRHSVDIDTEEDFKIAELFLNG